MKHILIVVRTYRIACCCLLLLLLYGPAHAKVFLDLNGELIDAAACNINNGQLIEVNFGDELMTTRIDGVNYSKTIDYTLDCSEAGTNAVQMQIQGTAASFDGNVLATAERSELGIEIKISNIITLPVNSWFKLTNTSVKPPLVAVPVKASGSELQPGSFSAGATMLFEYQ